MSGEAAPAQWSAPLRASAREVRRLMSSARFLLAERGPGYAVTDATDLALSYLTYPFAREERRRARFRLEGRDLPYFVHHYNRAWRNERAVEIAIAIAFLSDREPGARTLEVGNVLSHYLSVDHHVLDKYERSPRVINEDVVDYRPSTPYEAIVSISTLEHVGWDERPRDQRKVLRACEHLHDILAPGGQVLVTMGLGQNPHLDELIRHEALPFERSRYLRRTNKRNDWHEVALAEVAGARYGDPWRNANALYIGASGPVAMLQESPSGVLP